MAESVESHLESMAEEIEEMQRTKLYRKEEASAILKKRKHFEYKINGVSKNLQDFKEYIQYEEFVLRDVRNRRNKLQMADRKNSIEYKIIKRIKYLYEIAIQRFSNDFLISLSYFKFCRKSNFHKPASLILKNMIKNFSHKPEVWLVASACYVNTNLTEALAVVHKGLMIHKDCRILYKEAIRLELLNKEQMNLNPDSKSKEQVCCGRIKTCIHSIFKNINDFRFLIEILNMLVPQDFTLSAQNLIIGKLLETYSTEELVWHTLAQLEINCSIEKVSKDNLSRCFDKYREGLLRLPQSKKSALWALYLDFLINLQEKDSQYKSVLLSTLNSANDQSLLEERYFIIWAKISNDYAEMVKAIEKGLVAIPTSVELWKFRLKLAMMKDQVKEVNQTFKAGTLKLKEKAAPLWLMTIRYHTLTSNNDILSLIYKEAVEQPNEVANVVKPEYIQWLAMNKGIKNARKTYNLIAHKKPYCKELHSAMYKLESIEIDRDVNEMENVLNLACDQFGSEEVDVWLNLIEFYLLNYKIFEDMNASFNFNEKISLIYQRAENTLERSNDGLLLSDFKEKYLTLRTTLNL